MERLVKVRYRLVAAVDREGVLDEVVRPDAEEPDLLRQDVRDHGRGRDLDHDAQIEIRIEGDPLGRELSPDLVHQTLRGPQLGDAGDEGEHHAQVAVDRGPQDAPQLRLEYVGSLQTKSDRAQTQDRVRAFLVEDGMKVLLAAEVEGADDRLRGRDARRHVRIELPVLFLRGKIRRPRQEEELRAVQTDAGRPVPERDRDLLGELDVRQQRDRHAVRGC